MLTTTRSRSLRHRLTLGGGALFVAAAIGIGAIAQSSPVSSAADAEPATGVTTDAVVTDTTVDGSTTPMTPQEVEAAIAGLPMPDEATARAAVDAPDFEEVLSGRRPLPSEANAEDHAGGGAGQYMGAGLVCGPLYVPYQQLNGSWVALLASRNLCGPRRVVFDAVRPGDIPIVYQIGLGRCIALNLTPGIAGNAFLLLGKFAMTWYQAASFCQNRGWYYVYVY